VTYSIVARCPDTGQLGVAVQSHFFGTGAVVPWLAAGVGAVATQAMAEVAHGPDGLARLRAGRSPEEALADILGPDAAADTRQVAIVDATGRAAAHTGATCIEHAGHLVGDGFTTEANMMMSPGVPEAMAEAFSGSSGPLAPRLLGALDAAEATGGDIRGRQSAALVVVAGEPSERPGHDRLVDVRVEDDAEPLGELRRLVDLAGSYRRMEGAEDAMSAGDLDTALAIYAEAAAAQPHHPEFVFWHAVLLAGLGRPEEARAVVAPVFDAPDGERWRELVRRLPPADLLPADVVDGLLGPP
jgi:uncharacterized Ntn-hydrolase superfamily protein